VATAAYFRTQAGDEVDLVLETWDGRVVGFEVKAGSRVQDTDLSGLRLLRDRLGERFMAGFLVNLGELAYRKEERIMIMPLSGLWSLATRPTPGQRPARNAWLSLARWTMTALAYRAIDLERQSAVPFLPTVRRTLTDGGDLVDCVELPGDDVGAASAGHLFPSIRAWSVPASAAARPPWCPGVR